MSLVKLERDREERGVLTVVLSRPRMHNALVPELLADLLTVLDALRADPECKAVVLAADGPAFSIGGDMRRFQRERGGDLRAYAAGLVGQLNQAILALIALPQPVVAAVHGVVTGGSIGLVLAADLVYLAPQALFKAHYASAGFSPDGGWTALVKRLAGTRRAAAALLLNQTVRAADAVAWGFANEMVEANQLRERALAAARRIAASPDGTMRAAKRLLHGDAEALAADLEDERARFLELVTTAAAIEGVDSFLRNFKDYPDE